MANPEHLEILNQGVEVWNKFREGNLRKVFDLSHAHLQELNLSFANLSFANLSFANLGKTNLHDANLSFADLSGANLHSSNLYNAVLDYANLSNADLRLATLRAADFTGAEVFGLDLSEATIGWTSFDNTNLSIIKGLDTVRHIAPSTIGIDTLFRSGGVIPEIFLRGCGVPESFIIQIPALVAAVQPIEFYSCFISYSSKDQEFAERLHADLQAKGVRVWFAPHDLPIGARVRPAIDESIRVHDKLLLVLSMASVGSQWVEQEVETALAREREPEGKTVLFPIRIDDAVMQSRAGWPALVKNSRNVGDFTHWKDHDSYREAFDRLLRDLRAGA